MALPFSSIANVFKYFSKSSKSKIAIEQLIKKLPQILLIFGLLSISHPCFTQTDTLAKCCTTPTSVGINDSILHAGIDTIIHEALAAHAFPGAQVLVAKDGKIIYHQAWGWHTYDSITPVRLDDIYDFASITKVTASLPAIMKLIDEKKLALDAPLSSFYPPFAHSNKADLTLRQMLTHTAGLKAWIPFWKNTKRKNGKFKRHTFKTEWSEKYPISITDILFLHKDYHKKIFRAIKKSPVKNQGQYLYSDLSYYLYPEIVRRLSGKSFETYLKDNFYKKIGANSLTFNAYRHFPLKRIIPTERDTFFRNELIHGRVHDEGSIMLGGISGHAGLFGTATDLAKIFQMYLNGGTYGGIRLIKKATIDEFTRCQFCDRGIRRGIGFDKPLVVYDEQKSSSAKDASPATFGHSGYTGTLVWADPKYNLIYVFLSNRVHPTRLSRAIYQLNIRPRIHQVIYDAMLK